MGKALKVKAQRREALRGLPPFANKQGFRLKAKTPYAEIAFLLFPALAFLVVFRIYPLIKAIETSMFHTIGNLRHYVGIRNYIALFSDPLILESFRVTLVFSAIINPVQTVIALLLAVLLSGRAKTSIFFKGIFFIPVVVPMAVAAVIWARMLDPDFGIINGILTRLGLPAQPFLTSPRQALGGIIAMATWKGVGFWMVFFLAGLQNIPREVLESALVDGANLLQRFWYVTLPLLKRTAAFVLAADTAINFMLFAPVYMMTRGGPAGSTNLLIYEAYKTAFVYRDWGRACALTVIIAVVSFSCILMELRILQASHEY